MNDGFPAEDLPQPTQLQPTRRDGARGPRLARYQVPITPADFQALNEGQTELWLTLRRRPPSLTLSILQPGRRFVTQEDRAVGCWLVFPELSANRTPGLPRFDDA